MVMGGTIVLGGVHRFGRSLASAAGTAIPTVDQLVMTNMVDNIYDVSAQRGKLGTVTVERTAPQPMPLSEHGLAYHLASVRGDERKEILLDFAWTGQSLTNNYQVLNIDPTKADALIISHGHADHYGALPDLARSLHGRMPAGLTLYAGGEDTFCRRWVVTPDGQKRDGGQLQRTGLEAQGITVVLAKEPTVVAGHAVTSGQIPRLIEFEKPRRQRAWRRARRGLGVKPLCTSPRGRCKSRPSPASWCQTCSGASTRRPITSKIAGW
jgi:7,8-dihydropterin-6-yl-methyl-4-(beta-D-ribofuranosyl)aminobenzene 5'-phosphate synthase